MNKKIHSGIALTLLLVGMFTLAFNIQGARADWTWTETIYIRAEGSVDPDTALISTVDNITYTLTDNIVDAAPSDHAIAIIIERNNIVLNGAGCTLQGTDALWSQGIRLEGRSNVTIKNINIRNFHSGIRLSESFNNTVSGNNITNNGDGIWLSGSADYNSVSGNTIANNDWAGIMLDGSNNSISRNTFFNDGLVFSWGYGNVVVDNLVNNKPLVYLEGVSDHIIDDAGQVVLVNCNNIIVENLNLSHADVGLQLWKTSNTLISGSTIANNRWAGILLDGASNNNISGNDITNNNGGSIYLSKGFNNTFSGNNITNNGHGIWLVDSNYNTVSGNTVANNGWGIWLVDSNYTTVSGNTVANNGCGIWLLDSSSNSFYHNNIINNTVQAYDPTPAYNDWHHPDLLEGNYWSDYPGVDNGSGTGKHSTAGDGIGDTDIPWPGPHYDYYPFIRESGWMVITATIDIDPDTLNLRSKGQWITTYIELPEGYNVSDIDISTIMLNNTISAELHPTEVGDYDEDGILDLMVKFDRQEVIALLSVGEVTLTITGEVDDRPFEGSDTIRVIGE